MPPSSVVWFCLAQIIFAAKFGRVNCDLLQTLVNPLHSLKSESSGFSAGFCFLYSACWCVCVRAVRGTVSHSCVCAGGRIQRSLAAYLPAHTHRCASSLVDCW